MRPHPLIAVLLCSGCGTLLPATFEVGKPIPDPTLAAAMKGSTRAEVRSKLGEPCAIHQKSDGREWWYYEHAIIRNELDHDLIWTTTRTFDATKSAKEADVLTLIFEGDRLVEIREERGIKPRPNTGMSQDFQSPD